MRLQFCLLLWGLFAPLAHADEWHDYIQVQCEPDKYIFEVRDLRVPIIQVNGDSVPDTDSIETPGEIFLKWDKIAWTEVGNGDVRLAKDLGLNIPTCVIEESLDVRKFEYEGRSHPNGFLVKETKSIEFKVARTSIDQGNVQRQCGAVSSAEFTVYVNDTPLGVFPSARERCFDRASGSKKVSFSPRGLKHCEYADRMSTGVIDGGQFTTDVTVCHEGPAASYLKFITTMSANTSDEDAEGIASTMKDDLSRFKLRNLYSEARELSYENYLEKKKNEELSLALVASEKEKAALRDAQADLEAKLDKKRNKSFWTRLFQKDE